MAKRRRGLSVVLFALPVAVLALVGGLLWRYAEQRGPEPMTGSEEQVLGGPFELIDQRGSLRHDSDFRGHWMLITFGYTYCPDVCPTTLNTISVALDILARRRIEHADQIVPVFVSIDPERDSPAVLADYASHFHPALVALTGSPEQVAAAAERYEVQYRKAGDVESDDYFMDHSAYLHLIGPDGSYIARFQPTITPEKLAGALAKLTAL